MDERTTLTDDEIRSGVTNDYRAETADADMDDSDADMDDSDDTDDSDS